MSYSLHPHAGWSMISFISISKPLLCEPSRGTVIWQMGAMCSEWCRRKPCGFLLYVPTAPSVPSGSLSISLGCHYAPSSSMCVHCRTLSALVSPILQQGGRLRSQTWTAVVTHLSHSNPLRTEGLPRFAFPVYLGVSGTPAGKPSSHRQSKDLCIPTSMYIIGAGILPLSHNGRVREHCGMSPA